MKQKYAVMLPDNFIKGVFCNVYISLNGKKDVKQLKVCSVKARSVIFIEVDRVNRQNIFRKVDRADITTYQYYPHSDFHAIVVKDGILPVRWESSWDSIGQPSPAVANSIGRRSFSKHSQGWAPKLPSTTNSKAGFPMV